ncbi:FG-GAP repeat domain-containing protein [Jatrophihabitans sp. DSM 45814]
MRFRVVLAVFVGLCFMILGQSIAHAGTPTTTLTGDLTGDGIPDRIVLGGTGPTCTVTVAPGRSNGTFAHAVVHSYTVAGATNCPDLGAVGAFTHRGSHELVVAYFNGPPPTAAQNNLIVLRNYQMVDAAAGQRFPSAIGARDLNGDGLSDLFESTDEGQGLTTWMSVHGHLTAGPVHVVSSRIDSLKFADLKNNGNLDLLVGYQTFGAGAHASVVNSKTGVETVLATDPQRKLHRGGGAGEPGLLH